MKIVLRKRASEKVKARLIKKARIRKKVFGTSERLRVSVFKSNTSLYLQLIDDIRGHTLLALNNKKLKMGAKMDDAKNLGKAFGQILLEKGFNRVVFDRSGYLYHGKIKALADGIREAGVNI